VALSGTVLGINLVEFESDSYLRMRPWFDQSLSPEFEEDKFRFPAQRENESAQEGVLVKTL